MGRTTHGELECGGDSQCLRILRRESTWWVVVVERQALIKRPEQLERKDGTGVTFLAPLMCGGAERSSMEKFSFLIFPAQILF